MNITNIFAYRDIFKFIEELKKMEDPEFKISDFEFNGKKWIGLLAREKSEPKKLEK